MYGVAGEHLLYEHLLYEGICMWLLIAGVGMNICCMKESVCVWGCWLQVLA